MCLDAGAQATTLYSAGKSLRFGPSVRRLFRIVCLLLFCGWGNTATAATPLTIGTADSYSLGRATLEVLVDPGQRLTIDDVTSSRYAGNFQPIQADSPNFGITSAAYWFRFNVDFGKRAAEKWLLLLDQPLIDRKSVV